MEVQRLFFEDLVYAFLAMVIRGKCLDTLYSYNEVLQRYKKKTDRNKTVFLTGVGFGCAILGTIGALRVSEFLLVSIHSFSVQ